MHNTKRRSHSGIEHLVIVAMLCAGVLLSQVSCLTTTHNIVEDPAGFAVKRDRYDAVESQRLTSVEHGITREGALKLQLGTSGRCTGTVYQEIKRTKVSRTKLKGSWPCSTGVLLGFFNGLVGGAGAVALGLSQMSEEDNEAAVAVGAALVSVAGITDIACIVQIARQGTSRERISPTTKRTDRTERYDCRRLESLFGKTVVARGNGDFGPFELTAPADGSGRAFFDLFTVVNALEPPVEGLNLSISLADGEGSPRSIHLSHEELSAGSREFLEGFGSHMLPDFTGSHAARSEKISVGYEVSNEGNEIHVTVAIQHDEVDGITAVIRSSDPRLNGRILYMGATRLKSGGGDSTTLALDGIPRSNPPPLYISLWQRGERLALDGRSYTAIGADEDGIFGDWSSGQDGALDSASSLKLGDLERDSLSPRFGDATDWWRLAVPQHGKVEVFLQGEAKLTLARGTLPSGLPLDSPPVYGVKQARNSKGATLSFVGGGGDYYVAVHGSRIGTFPYRITSRLTPLAVRADIVARHGNRLEIERGGLHGVYEGRQGVFRYRGYRAGTFRVERVMNSRAILEVLSGRGQVLNRWRRLSAEMAAAE